MQDASKFVVSLRALEKDHTEMGMEIMKAADGKIYPFDLLAISVLNRSVALLNGFCDLIEKKNFVSAAPLIRLQLDNLLRFHAGWLVDKPHDFAMKILSGTKVSNIHDRHEEKMSDRYLVSKISEEYPHLKKVYDETSGFIHLSDKHIFSSLGEVENDGKFSMKVSITDSYVRNEDYIAAIKGFAEITGILFRYLKGWALTKDGGLGD